jgi:Spy/CpxP family protein refolding chaperone
MKPLAASFLLALLALLPAAASAQTGAGSDDPFARYLFPPDRIMSHSLEIGLEDAQKTAIRNEVQKAQPKFLDVQFELQGEAEKMTRLLQEKPVDEMKVLAQVDRILALEKEIKKTQISLLVRIKNVLTPAQQARLAEIQKTGTK